MKCWIGVFMFAVIAIAESGTVCSGQATEPKPAPVAAAIETTLATARGQIRQFAFDGDPDTFFASEKNPGGADHFTVVFDKPVKVKSIAWSRADGRERHARMRASSKCLPTARRFASWHSLPMGSRRQRPTRKGDHRRASSTSSEAGAYAWPSAS